MNTLDLSGKLDKKSIAVYTAIDEAARELDIAYVVVGASARDLVLHYGYGARLKRATADIDFGIQVPDWNTFKALSRKLMTTGFNETKTPHRLTYDGVKVDLVPFGALQDEEAKITWPPKGDVVMNVSGFQEAIADIINVVILDEPKVEIPVVMPPALSLLKIICWAERDADLKAKDAKDLLYLIKSYEDIPEIMDSIFEYPEFHTEFDSDIRLGSAFKLGADAGAIAKEQTKKYLKIIEDDGVDKRPFEQLVEDMCDNIEAEFEFNKKLLAAYFRGINYKQ